MNDYKKIMDRLKLYYNVKTYKDVSKKLNINYDTVKSWGTRKKVVMETLLECMKNEPVSVDWLITGNGSMRLTGDSISNIVGSTLGCGDVEVSQIVEKLLEDQETREMIELLPYATKEFIGSVKNRLEEFKKLSKI